MEKIKQIVKIIFIVALPLIFLSCLSYWSNDPANPVVICDAEQNQTGPEVVKTADGNYIIFWVDERRGTVSGFSWNYRDIYGQKLNTSGKSLWTEDGIPIVEGYGEDVTFERLTDIEMVPDGNGGVFFSWTDASGGGTQGNNVRINRTDSSGNKLWEEEVLLQDGDSGANNSLCSDGSGGVFSSWVYAGFRLWYNRLKSARLESSGTILTSYGSITAKGTPEDGEGPAMGSSKIINSGEGEAIIGWSDSRDGPYYGWQSLRVQKLGAGKTWTSEGVRVSLPNNVIEQIIGDFDIVSDGSGGVICFWSDPRSGDNDIFAQRVDSSGDIVWTEGGAALCDADGDQSYPQAVSDGSGGAVVVWWDRRDDSQIYAQRIDSDGNCAWTENGVEVGSSGGKSPRIVKTQEGNYIIFWLADAIMAQKIDPDGTKQWQEEGALVYQEGVEDDYKVMYDANGVIVVWSRGGNIYAQKLFENGTLSPTASTNECLN